MSIQSEIDRISENVSNALQSVEAKGVSVPEGANSDNLPELINEIFVGYEDAVRYSAQSLNDEQKLQARKNIGAVSETELSSEVTTQLNIAKESGEFDGKDGEDYVLTDADKEEIVAETLTALGTPMAGTVDEDNNIILGGELPDGTYTLKYYNQGEYIEIGKLVVSGGSGEAEIKNWLNFGTTELGGTEIYNGKGWKENTRWSASGNAPAAKDGMYLTGIIPVTEGDRVYTYDMPWVSSLSETAYWARYYANGNIDEVAVYGNFTPDENNVYEFVIPADVLGVRFSCFGISETSMITVNKKPIE